MLASFKENDMSATNKLELKLIRKEADFVSFECDGNEVVTLCFNEKTEYWDTNSRDTMLAHFVGLWFKTIDYNNLILNNIYMA